MAVPSFPLAIWETPPITSLFGQERRILPKIATGSRKSQIPSGTPQPALPTTHPGMVDCPAVRNRRPRPAVLAPSRRRLCPAFPAAPRPALPRSPAATAAPGGRYACEGQTGTAQAPWPSQGGKSCGAGGEPPSANGFYRCREPPARRCKRVPSAPRAAGGRRHQTGLIGPRMGCGPRYLCPGRERSADSKRILSVRRPLRVVGTGGPVSKRRQSAEQTPRTPRSAPPSRSTARRADGPRWKDRIARRYNAAPGSQGLDRLGIDVLLWRRPRISS
jgi:hypothetical protein